ncbi:hypothetical protein LCG56_27600 (plasmid) [Pseudomonas cannabina pv. alisalensis]|uniref:hypothetical protein n=1 Tax=Pseudomonas syringae group TaxID=136849 RepID=UPI0018659612|nr:MULTISPECIES: hypothetical protein [Pseudomonas syringae group]UBZ00529.1 hypothetical protein LCG56_27600 [Pseudomonas cannabina pv. alisalensis]
MFVVNEQFDNAAQRLLGKQKWEALDRLRYSGPDICREIAQDAFEGALQQASPTFAEDMELIQAYMPAVSWRRRPRHLRVNSRQPNGKND